MEASQEEDERGHRQAARRGVTGYQSGLLGRHPQGGTVDRGPIQNRHHFLTDSHGTTSFAICSRASVHLRQTEPEGSSLRTMSRARRWI
jgi:hypothetical protein